MIGMIGIGGRLAWRLMIAGIALCGAGPLTAAELQDFLGRWQGQSLDAGDFAGQLELQPAALELEASRDGNGFALRWTAVSKAEEPLAAQPSEARFAPTNRPGVFEVDTEVGALMSLFVSPSRGNPLLGETLLWARLAGDALTVYSLAIDARGGFTLDTMRWRPADQGMLELTFERRRADGQRALSARLAADGQP